MANIFDTPPVGYRRAKRGWLAVEKTPQKRSMDKLKAENAEMRKMLEEMHGRLSQLEKKPKGD